MKSKKGKNSSNTFKNQRNLLGERKPSFPKFKMNLYDNDYDNDDDGDVVGVSPQTYIRINEWISNHDFKSPNKPKNFDNETLLTVNNDGLTDITSVTRANIKLKGEYDDVKVEKRTEVVKCESPFQSVEEADSDVVKCENLFQSMQETNLNQIKCESPFESSQEDLEELVRHLRESKINKNEFTKVAKPATKFSQINLKSVSLPPAKFSVIMEGEESELPESTKKSEFSYKTVKTSNYQIPPVTSLNHHQIPPSSRPSSRHKRHAEMTTQKPLNVEKKQRKRRTLERIGTNVVERQQILGEIAVNRMDRQNKRKQQRQRQTEQFIKSMQMLQANCKSDSSGPFEDYSIFLYRQTAPKFEDRVKDLEKQFTYVPDYESKISGLKPLANTLAEEDVATKIKSLEDKWSNRQPVEKKPKDLMRAIGKIETSDWNIKQIEKKILENKIGKPSTMNADKERVPRWSKEEFRARQTKMEKKHLDKQDSTEAKYADIDRNIKQLDLKLKEGTNRELGQNKVATITEKLVSKVPQDKVVTVETPSVVQTKPANLPSIILQSGKCTEHCHFCKTRVYLMERLSAEGRFFHHGCFKCQYCHTQLRLGSYMFDRDGQYGFRFFCIHHYGMSGELPRPVKNLTKPSRQKGTKESAGKSLQKKALLSGVAGVDLLDRVQTPERVEFSNLSTTGNISSDHEDALNQMDEDEWTDKNFGASCNELDGSEDESSSSLSDSDSDDDDAYDDAMEQPITKEGTMKWAERVKNSYRKGRKSDSNEYSSSDHSSYYENSTDDSDSDTATEGEDEIRARELRRQEVRVKAPVIQTDTGTDTEVKKSLDNLQPDILNDHNRIIIIDSNSSRYLLPKSPSNYSINSDIFNSAESDLDCNMNQINNNSSACNSNVVVVGKLTLNSSSQSTNGKPPINGGNKPNLGNKFSPLAKSATAENLHEGKFKRNFVLPPKDQRRSFGQIFTPKIKLEEPLLVIRRTPSKVNLPKEIKPKVAINTKVLDTKKYFGTPTVVAKSKIKPPLIKQASLPQTVEEIDAKIKNSYNFELKDSDLENIDNYIEELLTKEDELQKPAELSKYAVTLEPDEEKDEVSSSIEDLFDALEKTTEAPTRELQKESDDKIEDLLQWMEELDHQTPQKKVYRSISDVKYKNLETLLKNVEKSSIVNKLPKHNVAYFEALLKGKKVPKDDDDDNNNDRNQHLPSKGLLRSKTEVHFNKSKIPRSSVDLDAVSNVNIKSVLKKFESIDKEDKKPDILTTKKRFSLDSNELPKKLLRKIKPKPMNKIPKKIETTKKIETSSAVEETLKDLEKFVDETIENIGKTASPKDLGKSKSDWCVNVTVSSKVSPEFLKLQQQISQKQEMEFAKELTNFQDAISAFDKDADINDENPAPINFSKAVESSDDEDSLNISSEYKVESLLSQNFAQTIESSSNESKKIPENKFIQTSSNMLKIDDTSIIPKKLEDKSAKEINLDELYAKVNKPKKVEPVKLNSPPVPRRRKNSAIVPPPRPQRQKSHDAKLNNENILPKAPNRKRSTTVSPVPNRKNDPEKSLALTHNGRSTSTSNLEVKKAVVTSFETPKPQKISLQNSKSFSTENLPKFPPKFGRKDKDKDCCIQ